jgi:hypothetical protein
VAATLIRGSRHARPGNGHNRDVPTPDRELDVMQSVFAALSGLDRAAQRRVLTWINERFGAPAEAVDARPHKAPGSVKDFVAQKKPSTAMERMTCLVYWATVLEGGATATTRKVNDLNALAGGRSFSDAGSVGQSVVASKGWLTRSEGKWSLTEIGKATVLALPDRAAVAALALTQ